MAALAAMAKSPARKKSLPPAKPPERAPVERLAHAGAEGFEITEAVEQTQRIIDAPLDRLWKAGSITRREYDAGERFRSDAYLAAVDPAAMTVDWSRAPSEPGSRVPAMFSSQTLADARIRWRRIEAKIPQRSLVSTFLYLGLIKEQNFEEMGQAILGRRDRENGVAAAKAGFRVALAALADHYGL